MKKLLKKSFADFMEEYDKNPLDEKVILTGNLYKDLDEYFVGMIYSGMFYVPKGYAFKVELVKDYFSFHLQIELLKKGSAPIMTCAECVGVYENGRINEYSCGDENIEMKRFILPMRELVNIHLGTFAPVRVRQYVFWYVNPIYEVKILSILCRSLTYFY